MPKTKCWCLTTGSQAPAFTPCNLATATNGLDMRNRSQRLSTSWIPLAHTAVYSISTHRRNAASKDFRHSYFQGFICQNSTHWITISHAWETTARLLRVAGKPTQRPAQYQRILEIQEAGGGRVFPAASHTTVPAWQWGPRKSFGRSEWYFSYGMYTKLSFARSIVSTARLSGIAR
jgi:hypothetical protein